MKYDEYYENIKNLFLNSIQTTDNELKDKIYKTLLLWYSNNFEEDLKKYFEQGKEGKIFLVSNTISEVCKLNDLNKLKRTYKDPYFDELCDISNEIFRLATNLNDLEFTDNKYKEYLDKINLVKPKISPIFQTEVEHIVSECELDLKYLLNSGNVNYYSIRLNSYIENK